MQGNTGSLFNYVYVGDPTGISTLTMDPEAGSIIIDPTPGTGLIRVKTSARGDNSGYAVVATTANAAALFSVADLTASGALSTLATNVSAHVVQGASLFTALVAQATAANAVALKTLGDTVQSVSPLTGATVTATITGVNETAYVTPAGTIAALTYALPADANSRIGQTLTVFSTQIVTALTVTLNGNTIIGTTPNALAVNTPVSFRKVAASTWIRLS